MKKYKYYFIQTVWGTFAVAATAAIIAGAWWHILTLAASVALSIAYRAEYKSINQSNK